MNAFQDAQTVEERSMNILRPFIRQRSFNGQYVVMQKGPLARELQKTVGDILINTDPESVYAIEIKAEESNKYGNFFLETWSNRSRYTTGWMYTLNTDLLLYHFIEDDLLYRIPFRRLRDWAFCKRRIYDFDERPQAKRQQLNDTWGRCVPITVLSDELSLQPAFRPRALGASLAA